MHKYHLYVIEKYKIIDITDENFSIQTGREDMTGRTILVCIMNSLGGGKGLGAVGRWRRVNQM